MSHHAVVVKGNTYHALFFIYIRICHAHHGIFFEYMSAKKDTSEYSRVHLWRQHSRISIWQTGKKCFRLHYMRISHGPETFYYHDYWLRCLLMICWCKLCDILVFCTINYSHHVFPCRLTCYSFRRVTTTKHTKQWIKLCHDICHGPCKEGGMCDIVNGTPTIIAV